MHEVRQAPGPLKWRHLLTLRETMKATAIEKPRSTGTVTVKLNPSDRDRIASLATLPCSASNHPWMS